MIWRISALLIALSVQLVSAEVFSVVDWNGRKALKLTGEIVAGTTARFNAIAPLILPVEHGLPIMLLDSPGGDVMEALMLSAAMQNMPFHTVIPNNASCASACASIVFIAGRYRTMETFGLFGQHSCATNGVPNPECNELISQHAFQHGVSHGAVAAFVTYVAPGEMLWFSRQDIDGWGISLYPMSEEAGFEKSEPRAIKMITGETPPPQKAWRIDTWNKGWRAFYRPVSDDERELQISQFCVEDIKGTLFLMMEIHGLTEHMKVTVKSIALNTNVFSVSESSPLIWQIDELVSGVTIALPTEKVKPWLTLVNDFEFSIYMAPPYQPIVAYGSLSGSRENLIFAANNCDKF